LPSALSSGLNESPEATVVRGRPCWWLTSVTAFVPRSYRKTSTLLPLTSTMSCTSVVEPLMNATFTPSALIDGWSTPESSAVVAEPGEWLTSRNVPVERSQRKTSWFPPASTCEATRSEHELTNVTQLPSPLIRARCELPLHGVVTSPAVWLTRVTASVVRSNRNTSVSPLVSADAETLLAKVSKTTKRPSSLMLTRVPVARASTIVGVAFDSSSTVTSTASTGAAASRHRAARARADRRMGDPF
jgi:hypothetical protein